MRKNDRQHVWTGTYTMPATSVFSGISTVTGWYRAGAFRTEAEARGALALAHQQALDGMGRSVAEWMGLTSDELDAYVRDDVLPERKRPCQRSSVGQPARMSQGAAQRSADGHDQS